MSAIYYGNDANGLFYGADTERKGLPDRPTQSAEAPGARATFRPAGSRLPRPRPAQRPRVPGERAAQRAPARGLPLGTGTSGRTGPTAAPPFGDRDGGGPPSLRVAGPWRPRRPPRLLPATCSAGDLGTLSKVSDRRSAATLERLGRGTRGDTDFRLSLGLLEAGRRCFWAL